MGKNRRCYHIESSRFRLCGFSLVGGDYTTVARVLQAKDVQVTIGVVTI